LHFSFIIVIFIILMPHFGGEKSKNGSSNSSVGGGSALPVLESSHSMDLSSVHSSNSSSTALEEKKQGADLLLSLAEKASEHAASRQSSPSLADILVTTTSASTIESKTNGVISRQVTPLMERNPMDTPTQSSNNRCVNGEGSGVAVGSPLMRMSVHGPPENHKLFPSPIKTQQASSSAIATSPLRALKEDIDNNDEKQDEGDSYKNGGAGGKRTVVTDAKDRDDPAVSRISKKTRIDHDNDTSPTSALLSLANTPIRCSSGLSNAAAAALMKTATSGNTSSRVSSNESHLANSNAISPPIVVMSIPYHHHSGGQQQQQPMYAPAPYSAYMHHPNNVVATTPCPPGHPPPQGPYSYCPAHFMAPPQQHLHQHHVVYHTGPGALPAPYYHIMGPAGVVPVPTGYTSTMHGPPPPHQHVAHHQQHRISPAPPPQQQQPQPAKSASASPTNDGAAAPTIMSPPRPRRTSPSTTTTSSVATTEETMSAKHAEAQAEACKSVSAWQQQQQQQQKSGLGDGGSSGTTLQCIPLKHPIQSRGWRYVLLHTAIQERANIISISPTMIALSSLLYYIPVK
jgi:hypothetical protein